ncbi:ubiquitin carboxyl-terminal hydrolase 21-like protein, partial [Cricetulus griseus]
IWHPVACQNTWSQGTPVSRALVSPEQVDESAGEFLPKCACTDDSGILMSFQCASLFVDFICDTGDRCDVILMLAGYSQQDAQEFLKLLRERLHLEINRRGCRAPLILASGPVPSPPRRGGALHEEPELSDDRANLMWKRYLEREDNKIVDLFVGQLKNCFKCQAVGSVHYGHYTALCWCQIGWHVYNDSHVFPVSENQVASNDGYSSSIVIGVIDFSHSDRNKMISQSGFELHFPDG